MGGLGPAPYGVMLLADLGAEVIRVDKMPGSGQDKLANLMSGVWRGRTSIAADLKSAEGVEIVRKLATRTDVFIDPFRPGVMERLGLGPELLMEHNSRLIYVRMTGYGQSGPMALRAGHDINFVALAGVLHTLGRADSPPPPPVGYIGDFGGGGTFLAIGVLAALLERGNSGKGQVLDVAVVDGVASLSAYNHGLLDHGEWSHERASNLSDGGCPFYECYETFDEKYVAVGALEPQFYANVLLVLGMDIESWPQYERETWPQMRAEFERRFAQKTRDEWTMAFDGIDSCVTPVLRLDEARQNPHNAAREVFIGQGDSWRPRAVPRFSRTDPQVGIEVTMPGANTVEVLLSLGYDAGAITQLREKGVVKSLS
jgi:alpha-methylacyl-CoA racemase